MQRQRNHKKNLNQSIINPGTEKYIQKNQNKKMGEKKLNANFRAAQEKHLQIKGKSKHPQGGKQAVHLRTGVCP